MKGTACVAMMCFLLGACAFEQTSGKEGGPALETLRAPVLETNTPAVGPEEAGNSSTGELLQADAVRRGRCRGPLITPVVVGACVSFQSVTCTVWDETHRTECLAGYGTWREDGNCFDRDRAPMLSCSFTGGTEYFFSHYETGTDAELVAAQNACDSLSGTVLP